GRGTHIRRVIPSYELIIVRSGTLEMREEDRQFHLQAGQALLLWPGREHAGISPYGADLSFYWIHFTLPYEGILDKATYACNQELGFQLQQWSQPARLDLLQELLLR